MDYSSRMEIGPLEYRFHWFATLLLVLVPVFIALGKWQLDRADEKAALKETLQARAEMPPRMIDRMSEDPAALRYRAIEVRGRYLDDAQFFIDGRRYGGRAGLHVITPFVDHRNAWVILVNRGWIPADPDGMPSEAPVPEGPLSIGGEADVPSPPAIVMHGGPDAAKSWGDRWPYLTVALYQAGSDLPVQPMVLLLGADQAGGFVRNWQRQMPNAWMHQGYAMQWFAFAMIALFLWARMSLSRAGSEAAGDSGPCEEKK